MIKIGLTGGIGSGKSTVTHLFEKLSVPIISCDTIAHALLNQPEIKQEILLHFGPALCSDTIDRQLLRQIIFEDRKQRIWLENLLHPNIKQKIVEAIYPLHCPYVVIEIPLLIEAKWEKMVDRILLVASKLEHQITRIMQRDHIPHDLIMKILQSQTTDAQRKKVAHDIIDNNGSMKELTESVHRLHQQYLSIANSK